MLLMLFGLLLAIIFIVLLNGNEVHKGYYFLSTT